MYVSRGGILSQLVVAEKKNAAPADEVDVANTLRG
jgi:hypothetical protein